MVTVPVGAKQPARVTRARRPVRALNAFEDGAEVTTEALIEKGIIKAAYDGVKILSNGTLNKKLTVKVAAYSAAAKQKIEAAGGKAEVV